MVDGGVMAWACKTASVTGSLVFIDDVTADRSRKMNSIIFKNLFSPNSVANYTLCIPIARMLAIGTHRLHLVPRWLGWIRRSRGWHAFSMLHHLARDRDYEVPGVLLQAAISLTAVPPTLGMVSQLCRSTWAGHTQLWQDQELRQMPASRYATLSVRLRHSWTMNSKYFILLI